jgi:hypothetical protein
VSLKKIRITPRPATKPDEFVEVLNSSESVETAWESDLDTSHDEVINYDQDDYYDLDSVKG